MSIIKKYRAEVVSIDNPIENIFCVEMKSFERKFSYFCGQFIHLSLDEYDPSFQWPESRCFSLQSSPDEENIRITFAVKGEYTQKMANELKIGKQVSLKMPFGDLFLQEHSKNNCVFIAGGTGITPFLSLFTDNLFKEYKSPILYLGLRNKSFDIYQKDLEKAKNNNTQLESYVKYEDISGILNIKQILLDNGNNRTYFISGPVKMIKTFKSYLLNNSVSNENIKTDDWE